MGACQSCVGGPGPLAKDEADVFPAKLKGSAERGSAHEEHPAPDVHKPVNNHGTAQACDSPVIKATLSNQPHDDQALRAMLLHGKQQAAAAAELYSPVVQHAAEPPAATDPQPGNPELTRLHDQLTKALALGHEGMHRSAQLLNEARHWLAKSGTVSAADALTRSLLSVLTQLQDLLLTYDTHTWTGDTMAAGLALLHLFSDVSQQALNPRPHAKPLRAVMTQAMLLTPAPLTLLLKMLAVAYQVPTPAAAERHPHCALALWELLRGLMRMAAVVAPQSGEAGCGGQLGSWQPLLRQLTQPPGLLASLMGQPMDVASAAPYMAACQALRSMYELQSTCTIDNLDIAQEFAGLHFTQFKRYYLAAGADPRSAAAELCRLHMRLLQAAVATRSPAVRVVLQQLGAVDMVLQEVSLEATLYSAEQAQAAMQAQYDGEGDSEEDSDGEEEGQSQLGSPGKGDRGSTSSRSPQQAGAGGKKFTFTYDLNEDLERLLALEEATGEAVELDGFEYDDEARMLMARSDARAALTPAPPPQSSSPRAPPRNLPPLRLALNNSPSRPALRSGRSTDRNHQSVTMQDSVFAVPGAGMFGGDEGPRPSIPKLSLVSLASAASSRIATPIHQRPDPTMFASARSRHSQMDAELRSSAQLSVHGSMAALEVPTTSRSAHHSSAHHSSNPSLPSHGSYKLRSHVSLAESEGVLRSPPLQNAGSSHLHHSHLSPLSTRRSTGPSPRTTVITIPAPAPTPAAAPLDGAIPPHRRSEPQKRATLNGGGPPQSSRLAATSYRVRVEDPAACDTESGPAAQSVVAVRDSSHNQPQADDSSPTLDEQLARQITCAGFLLAQQHTQDMNTMASELWDSVPELQPRPPTMPTSGPQGQVGRGLAKPVPVLNLNVLSGTEGGTVLSSSQRNGALSSDSALLTAGTMTDSAMNPNHQPPSPSSPYADPASSSTCGPPLTYQAALLAKLWYHDMMLHASLLRLLLQLMLTPTGGLDPAYAQPFPSDVGVSNVEHVLTWHFSGPPGSAILPELVQLLVSSAAQPSPTHAGQAACAAAVRLLRLLSRSMFDSTRYQDLIFHSRGAYGAIYRAKATDPVTNTTQQVMIKAIELPGTGYDRCILPEVYGEVSILDKYALQASLPTLLPPDMMPEGVPGRVGHPGICQLKDYGLTQGAYWIVMRRYRCSLAEWRARQPRSQSASGAALYLSVLQQVVEAMMLLAADSVVHFDLKAANVLVEPLEGVKDGQLYGSAPAPPCLPPFRAVLADFGEARAYRSAEEAYTARNRGTEVYKSPEMLLMHSAMPSQSGQASQANATNPRQGGAGLASDVWSFGCLAYEVLSGRALFGEADYASVTHRVAFGAGPYLSLTGAEVSSLGPSEGSAALQGLVEGILVRDPEKRPSLKVVSEMLQDVREAMLLLAQQPQPAPPA